MMRGHVAIASSPRRRHRARRSRISVVRAVAPPRPHGRNAGHRTKQFTAPPTESPTTHILSRGEKSKRRSIARFNPKVNPNELPPRQSSSSYGSWSTFLTEHTPPLGTIDDMRTARAASLTGMRRRAARVVAGALPSVNLARPPMRRAGGGAPAAHLRGRPPSVPAVLTSPASRSPTFFLHPD